MDSIIAFLEKLIDEFTWKRLTVIIVIGFLFLAGIACFEFYTGHFRLNRVEKASELLEKLNTQSTTITSDTAKEVKQIHNALIKDLQDFVVPEPNYFPTPRWVVKGLWAFLPWLCVIIMFRIVQGGSLAAAVGGVLVFSIPFVVVGALIPDFGNKWINILLYPFGSCAVVLILMWAIGRTKPS